MQAENRLLNVVVVEVINSFTADVPVHWCMQGPMGNMPKDSFKMENIIRKMWGEEKIERSFHWNY